MPGDEGQADEGQAAEVGNVLPARGPAPFGETANPAEYVPRDATEEALRALEQAFRSGGFTALTAPPGLGKSLLLRLLADRLGDELETVFLAYAALELDELCAWSLGLLGIPVSDEPRATLLRRARALAEEERTLALFVDDGSSMPLETARALGELLRESGGRLRIVIAAGDDAVSRRVLVALDTEIDEVRFTQPMSPRETRAYVHTRLEQAGVPAEERARFHDEAIGWIHRLSGGVPRRVHELSCAILDKPPEGVGSGWRDERWLGAPLGEIEGESGDGWPDEVDRLPSNVEPAGPEALVDEDEDPGAL